MHWKEITKKELNSSAPKMNRDLEVGKRREEGSRGGNRGLLELGAVVGN